MTVLGKGRPLGTVSGGSAGSGRKQLPLEDWKRLTGLGQKRRATAHVFSVLLLVWVGCVIEPVPDPRLLPFPSCMSQTCTLPAHTVTVLEQDSGAAEITLFPFLFLQRAGVLGLQGS